MKSTNRSNGIKREPSKGEKILEGVGTFIGIAIVLAIVGGAVYVLAVVLPTNIAKGIADPHSNTLMTEDQQLIAEAMADEKMDEHLPSSLPTGSSSKTDEDEPPRSVGPGTEYCIKGNISDDGERIYHMPGDEYYDKTVIDTSRGERWFSSPEEAEAAGWRRAYV